MHEHVHQQVVDGAAKQFLVAGRAQARRHPGPPGPLGVGGPGPLGPAGSPAAASEPAKAARR